MNFFKQLASLGSGSDLQIHIKEKNGKMTVSVTPEVANKAKIMPLVLTGTTDELDEGFFNEVGSALDSTKGLVSNSSEFKKSVSDAVQESSKKKDDKKSPTKPADKKKAPAKKGDKKKPAKAPEEASSPDIFSQPPVEQTDEQVDAELTNEAQRD